MTQKSGINGHEMMTLEQQDLQALFPCRILCFLRYLLFQVETNSMHPLFANADSPAWCKPALNRRKRRQRSGRTEHEDEG